MKKNFILFLTSVAVTTSLIPTNFVFANTTNSEETKVETKANSEFNWSMETVVKHFKENVDKYNIVNPETELVELRSYNGTNGEYIVRFNAAYNGIRIPDYEFIVIFNEKGDIKAVNGNFPKKTLDKLINSETRESISEIDAVKIARESVKNPAKTEDKDNEEIEVLYMKRGNVYEKVYCVKFPGYDKEANEVAYWNIFISCKDGAVIKKANTIIFN